MGLKEYQLAKDLVNNHSNDFVGSISESMVVLAEQALNVTFPPSYRQFLLDFGCGVMESFGVYGLGPEDLYIQSVYNTVWLTIYERKSMELNPAYIIIGSVGDGSYYALDTRIKNDDGENPVMVVSVEYAVEEEASDFGTYFLNEVKHALES